MSLKDFKNFKKELVGGWKYIQKNRFKHLGPYKSDRWIWNGAMLLIFVWLWFIAYSSNYNLDYFKCGDGEVLFMSADQFCKNPFYKETNSWKCSPTLPYGEYGTKPTKLFKNAGLVSFLILVFAGVLNHFWHNRKFKLRLPR